MMSGNAITVERRLTTAPGGVRTITLVGRTGNGKSATGNTILGKKVFKSYTSSSGVTSSCELQQTVRNGQLINVIDTPGLFDISAGSDFVAREIVKCMNLARDGIHGFLLVYSALGSFSEEEAAVFNTLMHMFGREIINYMIVVFTGGDLLEEDGMTLDDYLGGANCPKALKEILRLCKNRRVLFDNKTQDEYKKSKQVQGLLSLVDKVITQNGGQPYTNEYFLELKTEATRLRDQQEEAKYSTKGLPMQEILELQKQMHRQYEEQLKNTIDKVEARFKETIEELKAALEEEKEARSRARPPINVSLLPPLPLPSRLPSCPFL